MIPRRSIGLCILWSLLTCGMYSLYWFICLTNEVNEVNQEPGTSGGMAVLYSFITCGIYFFYWGYSTGNKLDDIRHKNGKNSSSFGILLLLLNIFSFGIISYCIIQNELNQYAN